MQPFEKALRFLLADRAKHGDSHSSATAQRHLDEIGSFSEPKSDVSADDAPHSDTKKSALAKSETTSAKK